MGQLHSTCTALPHLEDAAARRGGDGALDVALQVAFERQALKPGVSLDR
jgi:hypothetical protein